MKHDKYSFLINTPLLCGRVVGCLFWGLFWGLFVNAAIYANEEIQPFSEGVADTEPSRSEPSRSESSRPKSSREVPLQCSTNCETNYGIVIGESPAGVPAYSNCNAECVIFEPHHLNKIYTGIKWQCVEYARRWLLQERGVVFGDVDIAADIWVMQEVNNPITKQTYNFNSVVNGASTLPLRGDLLIYGKDYLGTGHVAVVVAVDEKKQTIQVAEQNFANTLWQNKHAREIYYTTSNERVWLLDSYLIGWKRLAIEMH